MFSANLTLSFYHSCVAKFFYSFILTSPPPPIHSNSTYFLEYRYHYDISFMFYLVDRIPVIITHKMPFFQSFFSTSFHVDHHMCHIFHHCVLRLFSLLRNSCVKRTGCLSKHCWNIANYTTMKQQDLFFFSTDLIILAVIKISNKKWLDAYLRIHFSLSSKIIMAISSRIFHCLYMWYIFN